ncbi:MAG: MCE family protein [Leptolyngbya sp. SIO1D8]|nr:MCE family protein [Leptolyngbya sp. SIO1D8]
MRARAIREGSVGLLILIGVGLFGGLVLWLRGLNPGSRNYNFAILFENTSGMQLGTAVRYRGVPVGRVVRIQPSSNEVEVHVEVTQADLRIPREARIEANQSGLIGETTIDITPDAPLTDTEQTINPTSQDCDAGPVICEGDLLDGKVGVSYESLLRSTETLANTLADPALVNSLKTSLENAAVFTEEATALVGELTKLTLTAQEEITPLSTSIQEATESTAAAAQQIQLTAADARSLLEANQFNLTQTLDNITRGSDRLVAIADVLATQLEDPQFLTELRTLSTNAAEASINLRNIAADLSAVTGSLNQPENLLLIQQTLESARDVFQSAQKILSDVDELTGDPAIRNNIRDLINGLSDLVSSTQILEQQVELAGALAPLSTLSTPLTVPVPAHRPTITNGDYRALQAQLEALAAQTSSAPEEQTTAP